MIERSSTTHITVTTQFITYMIAINWDITLIVCLTCKPHFSKLYKIEYFPSLYFAILVISGMSQLMSCVSNNQTQPLVLTPNVNKLVISDIPQYFNHRGVQWQAFHYSYRKVLEYLSQIVYTWLGQQTKIKSWHFYCLHKGQ